jgi:uncharacterized membrane protein
MILPLYLTDALIWVRLVRFSLSPIFVSFSWQSRLAVISFFALRFSESLSTSRRVFCWLRVSGRSILKLERVNLVIENSFWKYDVGLLVEYPTLFFCSRYALRFTFPFSASKELISKSPRKSLATFIFRSIFFVDIRYHCSL